MQPGFFGLEQLFKRTRIFQEQADMNRVLHSLMPLLVTIPAVCIGCAAGGGSEDASGSEEQNFPAANYEYTDPLSFCGTAEPDHDQMESLSTLFAQFGQSSRLAQAGLSKASTEIPVVFHVISKGPTFEDGEVPDSMLIQQIDVLNKAFSGEAGGIATPYRFRLASINRVRNSEWHVMSPGSESEMAAKKELHMGGAGTLNIYVVDIQASGEVAGGRGKILGYTTLPILVQLMEDYDGMVLNYQGLAGGPLEHYNTGNVAVHEAGHWLGLLHTFTGECDGLFDDLVQDTAREKVPEKGNYCPVGRDSCPEANGSDPVHNHMTYTGDECRSRFTQGQVDFMQFNAVVFRQMF